LEGDVVDFDGYFRNGVPREIRLSKAERVQVRQRARRRLLSHPRKALRFAAVLLLPVLVYLGLWGLLLTIGTESLISQLGAGDPRVGQMFVLLAGGKLGALPIVVISAMIAHRRYYRPHVLAALREMGYEVCGNCGYLLRGLGEDVQNCPECGEPREALQSIARKGNA